MLTSRWVQAMEVMLESILQLTSLLKNTILAVLPSAYCYSVKCGSLSI
jgi:hypothetical protein